jgi:8-oxo-dGTP diphosphatase
MRTYPNTFYRVSIKALITNQEGKVLVVKENQDTWSPGGGLDHGEDPKSGILRELKEELGIEAPHVKDIATIKTFYLEHKSAGLLWVVYEVEAPSQELVLGEGVAEARYIDIAELKQSTDIFEMMVYAVASRL